MHRSTRTIYHDALSFHTEAFGDPSHPALLMIMGATASMLWCSAFDEDDPALPPMDPALLGHFGTLGTLDWSDRGAVVDFHVESFRISAGAGTDFDEPRARDLAEREYDRALNPESAMNHSMLGGGELWAGRLSEVRVPTLVLHGQRDPILSLQHRAKLASKIRDARRVALDGGHELNPRHWARIVAEIGGHTADDIGEMDAGPAISS